MKKLNTVLLVEDDDVVNFYNEFLLKDLGLTENVAVARNGRDALQYLDKCDSNAPGFNYPDLIFLDINMPIMNGFEFIEEYQKRSDQHHTKALVVMLTTSLHPKDVERAKGFHAISEYLYKPLMQDSLKDIVKKYFG